MKLLLLTLTLLAVATAAELQVDRNVHVSNHGDHTYILTLYGKSDDGTPSNSEWEYDVDFWCYADRHAFWLHDGRAHYSVILEGIGHDAIFTPYPGGKECLTDAWEFESWFFPETEGKIADIPNGLSLYTHFIKGDYQGQTWSFNSYSLTITHDESNEDKHQNAFAVLSA